MDWWSAALAFAGAALGSGLSWVAARRDVAQRERAARADVGQRVQQANLEEWGRRFTAALAGVSSESPRQRALSRVLLVELGQSDLATEQEKALVLAVLDGVDDPFMGAAHDVLERLGVEPRRFRRALRRAARRG